jgi:hypothetical protein
MKVKTNLLQSLCVSAGFLISFHSASAEVCPSLGSLNEEIEQLVSLVGKKKCSLENQQLFEGSPATTSTLETVRLSTKCANQWPVKTAEGIVHVPAGLRVIRFGNSGQTRIVFHLNGKIHEGLVDEKVFTGEKSCLQKEEKPNPQAFYEEALFQLNLAKKIHPKANAYFDQTVEDLIHQLNSLKQDPKGFETIVKKWKKQINNKSDNKVERVQNFQAMLQKVYNPKTYGEHRTSESTLIVPLSVDWFNSTPELQTFFKTTWINSAYDIRILSGGSGEGVSYYPDQNESSNESFIQMNSLLEKTAEFIKKTAKDEKSKNSPEAKWLEAMPKHGKSSIERMIFFSPETWKNEPESVKWADYIPVDQGLGGLPSDYLLSVMIHEINVNSPNFLASDTHGPKEDTKKLRDCLSKYSIHDLGEDPVTLERVFGLNSQIETIYLKAILD